MMRRSLFVSALFCAATRVPAQLQQAWWMSYDGPEQGEDYVWHTAVDAAGCVYFVGDTWSAYANHDVIVGKVSPDGQLRWVQRWDGPSHEEDVGLDVAVSPLGGVVVRVDTVLNGQYDFVLLRYSASGDLLWEHRYDGGGDDFVYTYQILAVGADGTSYTTGRSAGPTSADCVTLAVDASGSLQWADRYDSPGAGNDYGYGLRLDSQGDVVVLTDAFNDVNFTRDIGVLKYDPDGQLLWARLYDGPAGFYDTAYSLALDASDNIISTGIAFTGSNDFSIATIKYAPDGTRMWSRLWDNGYGHQYGFSVAADPRSGRIAITGETWGFWGDTAMVTLLYQPDGTLSWARTYEDPRWVLPDWGVNCEFGDDGDVFAAGVVWTDWNEGYDGALLRYDAAGSLRSDDLFRGPVAGNDAFWSINIHKSGGALYIGGQTPGQTRGSDVLLVKYGLKVGQSQGGFALR